MSSFLAVSLNSLIIVIILSSTACVVLFISSMSVCRVLISAMAFLWFVSMFCSTMSSFFLISLYLSSPTLSLAEMIFTCSVIPLSGGGGGVFVENIPFFAGSGAWPMYCSSGMVNVYILLTVNFLMYIILNLRDSKRVVKRWVSGVR